MKNLNLLQKLLYVANWLFAMLLLIALLARFISPKYFSSIAVVGLSLPFLAIVNILCLILWIALLKRQFLLPLLALAISYWHLDDFMRLEGKHKTFSSEKHFRVMSYNIASLMYKKKSRQEDNYRDVVAIIKAEKPDILCLQETYWTDFDIGYQYMAPTKDSYHIQSKYPIINWGIVPYADNNINKCYFADIKVHGDTLRVYNAHLASTRFSLAEKNTMTDLNEELFTQDSLLEKNTSSILAKLKYAFELRADQVNRIANHITLSPYKVILCGDFNDTAASYAYHTLTQKLDDSFVNAGSGFGNSFSELAFPLRIDYILHSPTIVPFNYYTVKNKQSDHLAIRTDFVLE